MTLPLGAASLHPPPATSPSRDYSHQWPDSVSCGPRVMEGLGMVCALRGTWSPDHSALCELEHELCGLFNECTLDPNVPEGS